MAEENEKKEEATEEEPTKESGGKKKLPLGIIIGAVVAVLVLGGGGFFLWTQLNPAEAAEDVEEPDEEIVETNIYYEGFPTNIVNLAISQEHDYMYLKYNYIVEVTNDGVISEIVTKQPRLIALVSIVMSNRDWSEIGTPQGKERLSREAMRVINDQLSEGQVIGLYFVTFVAQ